MKALFSRVKKRLARLWDVRILIGLIGFMCSVLFHEMFHVIMHWGDVTKVSVFTGSNAIAEVDAYIPRSYDIAGEEIAAYAITLITLLTTMAIISKVGNRQDNRTFSQTLSGKDNKLGQLTSKELMDLANRHDLLGTRRH